MLSNAYFLAKFRFDTAENEPAKILQNFRKMHFRLASKRWIWLTPRDENADEVANPGPRRPLAENKRKQQVGIKNAPFGPRRPMPEP